LIEINVNMQIDRLCCRYIKFCDCRLGSIWAPLRLIMNRNHRQLLLSQSRPPCLTDLSLYQPFCAGSYCSVIA